ncbi:hypothetical protein FE374_05125 [Georgenia yuyongxinii]|uniref:Uncharacterized protein n=1 Tax=Georgenia yuyongxinii TaxID=2589797 RepID=A0A5B8C0P2_9MICO|nr:hypothetical protein [Georgenia yuyongxinii]QDC24094.1 hypothetical protein FE374_05125 [Georgenia yuyongxinii]
MTTPTTPDTPVAVPDLDLAAMWAEVAACNLTPGEQARAAADFDNLARFVYDVSPTDTNTTTPRAILGEISRRGWCRLPVEAREAVLARYIARDIVARRR